MCPTSNGVNEQGNLKNFTSNTQGVKKENTK
jgi:hypothetical protein